MALTVEDGTGLAAADAYISEAFADTYHGDRCNDGWKGTSSKKEAAIRVATEYLDSHYDWEGDPVLPDTQALDWPRSGVVTSDGVALSSTALPVLLQRATAEMAMVALQYDLDPIEKGAPLTSVQERVGDVSTLMQFAGAGSTANRIQVPRVKFLLRELVVSVGGFGTSRPLRA